MKLRSQDSMNSPKPVCPRMKPARLALATVAVLCSYAFAAHAISVPIVNYSFESPAVSPTNTGVTILYPSLPPGWTLQSGNAYLKVFGSVYMTPADGNQTLHADLNPDPNIFSNFTLSQTLSDQTVAGKDYQLSLYMASGDSEPPLAFAQLQFNGTTVGSVTNYLVNSSLVKFSTAPFTATASGETIKVLFGATSTSSVNSQGVWFDNFELIAVPEPTSVVYLLLSAFGLVAIRRRRSLASS